MAHSGVDRLLTVDRLALVFRSRLPTQGDKALCCFTIGQVGGLDEF